MTALWRLLGMSRASKTYGQYIQAFQAENIARDISHQVIQRELGIKIPLNRFRNEWGIVSSAQTRWNVMDKTPAGRIVRAGYQRTVFKQIQRYKIIVRLEVVNQDTGEIFDMHTTVYSDSQLKRSRIRELATEAIRKSSTTKLEFLTDELEAGYESR